MGKINVKIEGIPYQVEEGLTILEAAKACGYEIPSLCTFNHGECNQGSCRVCLVEATGARGLVASCVYPVAEGMEVRITTPSRLIGSVPKNDVKAPGCPIVAGISDGIWASCITAPFRPPFWLMMAPITAMVPDL